MVVFLLAPSTFSLSIDPPNIAKIQYKTMLFFFCFNFHSPHFPFSILFQWCLFSRNTFQSLLFPSLSLSLSIGNFNSCDLRNLESSCFSCTLAIQPQHYSASVDCLPLPPCKNVQLIQITWNREKYILGVQFVLQIEICLQNRRLVFKLKLLLFF